MQRYLKIYHVATNVVQCPYCMAKPYVPCRITFDNGIHFVRLVAWVAFINNLSIQYPSYN